MELFGVEALVFTIFFRGIPIFLTGRPIYLQGWDPHSSRVDLYSSGVGPIFFKSEPVLKEVFIAECNFIQSFKIKRDKQKS